MSASLWNHFSRMIESFSSMMNLFTSSLFSLENSLSRSVNLITLSFDIIFNIASSLSLQNLRNLSRANERISWILKNESIACAAIMMCKLNLTNSETDNHQSNIAFTKEIKHVKNETITYLEALDRVFSMREACVKAKSYFAALLVHEEYFIYNDDVLCYVSSSHFYSLKIHDEKNMRVIQLSRAVKHLILELMNDQFSLLYYKERILFCRCRSHIISLNIRSAVVKALLSRQFFSEQTSFVRNNKFFLYYDALQDNDTWIIIDINLKSGALISHELIHLESLVGSDIGKTICFEIFESNLYAVSTGAV